MASTVVGDNGEVSGSRPALRWLGPVLGAAVFLLLAVPGFALVADWSLRNAEMNALVSRVEVSEDAMGNVEGQLDATFQDYASLGQLTPDERSQLNADSQGIAQDGHDAIQQAGDGVAGVVVLPWHTAIVAAKKAYVRHNLAWQDYLAKAAQDPQELTRTQTEVNDSFAAAEPAMKHAVPIPSLYHLKERVLAIFAPPPASSGGGDGGGGSGGSGGGSGTGGGQTIAAAWR